VVEAGVGMFFSIRGEVGTRSSGDAARLSGVQGGQLGAGIFWVSLPPAFVSNRQPPGCGAPRWLFAVEGRDAAQTALLRSRDPRAGKFLNGGETGWRPLKIQTSAGAKAKESRLSSK